MASLLLAVTQGRWASHRVSLRVRGQDITKYSVTRPTLCRYKTNILIDSPRNPDRYLMWHGATLLVIDDRCEVEGDSYVLRV